MNDLSAEQVGFLQILVWWFFYIVIPILLNLYDFKTALIYLLGMITIMLAYIGNKMR